MRTFCMGIALVLSFAWTGTSSARVGWTKKQCVERYGAPAGTTATRLVKSDGTADVFKRGEVEVVAEYRGGKVWIISYYGRKLTKTNAEKILAGYAKDGARWKEGEFVGATHWNDVDSGLHATYYLTPHNKLVVFSSLALEASYKPKLSVAERDKQAKANPAKEGDGNEAAEPEPDKKKDPFDGF